MATLLLAVAVAVGVSACLEEAGSQEFQTTFPLGVDVSFYPWEADVTVHGLSAVQGGSWSADFDVVADTRRLRPFLQWIDQIAAVVVGEPVYGADGVITGMTATSVSSHFTAAGIPLSYYEGTMPVTAFGNRRGSPFEDVVIFSGEGEALASFEGNMERGDSGRPPGRILPAAREFVRAFQGYGNLGRRRAPRLSARTVARLQRRPRGLSRRENRGDVPRSKS
ncbi:MAG: hypothetical protein M5R36_04380 [Deltaproteobacteria bacterium]|nr:hypothetical protein [Deltaproteobacteria bacterium]